MKLLQKIIITLMCLAPTSAVYASTSGSGEASGTVTAVNEIAVTLGGISITTSESGAGVFNGTDAYTLDFSNNNSAGYVVNVTPSNGYFLIAGQSGDLVDGDMINYEIACDGYSTLSSTSETVSAYNETAISGSGAVNIYTVSNPVAATCVSSDAGCNTPPSCDITLGDDEDVDENFGGAFSETLTFEIVNS